MLFIFQIVNTNCSVSSQIAEHNVQEHLTMTQQYVYIFLFKSNETQNILETFVLDSNLSKRNLSIVNKNTSKSTFIS